MKTIYIIKNGLEEPIICFESQESAINYCQNDDELSWTTITLKP